jgi:hypothetical protein
MSAAMPAASALSAPAREHAQHPVGDAGLEIRLERGEEGVDCLLRQLQVHVLEVVDADQAGNTVGRRQCGLDDDRAAHRMAHQHRPLQVELLQHRGHVAAERLHRIGLAFLARGAVTGQVDHHHAVRGREVLHLLVPVRAVAAPAVDEDQRGIPLALVGEVDGDAVGRGGRAGGGECRGGSGQGGNCGQQQQHGGRTESGLQ